ncbi:MAG: thiamine-phosphate kinase [Mariprofundus sp.]|nr:thiamine-phosphate kinase [Mariprofundus sp.]
MVWFKSMGEFDLIERCFVGKGGGPSPFTLLGIGDDASLHQLEAGMELVVSSDSSLAGVHWPVDLPLEIGADRAICSALSDLAAMGAEPLCCWLNVMAESSDAVVQMGAGATAALKRHGVELVGGDTTRALCNALSVTVAGKLPKATAMRRDQGLIDDKIWILGRVGFHRAGLQQWFDGQKEGCFMSDFHRIEPLLTAAVQLREQGVRCCMDVSDGLLQDAMHLASASSMGMEIELSLLPDWQQLVAELGEESAIHYAAYGGEDYALLFTAPASMYFDGAACIGHCSAEAGVRASLNHKTIEIEKAGYDHFK